MPNPLTNDFTASPYNNNIRPYTKGFVSHGDPLATIILFSDGTNPAMEPTEKSNIDFLNNLSSHVSTFISEAAAGVVSGNPDTPAPLIFATSSQSTGLLYKDNKNYVENPSGGKIPVFKLDGINDYYGVFNNFSLISFTESHNQITKVHMNLSASWNVFFLGNSPNIYKFNGYFIDTKDYPYYQEFMVAYESILCGRKAVENHIQTKIMVAGQLIDGYLLSVDVSHNANTKDMKEFQFTMLVKGTSWIRTNIVYDQSLSSGFTKKEQSNGLSNKYRLQSQTFSGLIEDRSADSVDTSGKTSQIIPGRQ